MTNESNKIPVGTRLIRGIRQAACIIILGTGIALCVNVLHSGGLPLMGDWRTSSIMEQHTAGIPTLTPDEAFTVYLDGTALFLDARTAADFASGALPDALNIPPDQASSRISQLRDMIASGCTLIAYCDGPDCPLSAELARRLQTQGLTAHVLPQGISGWVEAGYPLGYEVTP